MAGDRGEQQLGLGNSFEFSMTIYHQQQHNNSLKLPAIDLVTRLLLYSRGFLESGFLKRCV